MKNIILVLFIALASNAVAQKTKVDSIKASCDSLIGTWELVKVKELITGKVVNYSVSKPVVYIVKPSRRKLNYEMITLKSGENLISGTIRVSSTENMIKRLVGIDSELISLTGDSFVVKDVRDGDPAELTFKRAID
ncbi:MAG: hypothetical protein ACPGLV_03265 [Bacteroidia bacterium]